MKTQKKQLPNEFTFVCDEHSKSQLEKLGVELDSWSVLIFGYIYLVKNNKVIDYNYGGFNIKYKYAENLTTINLADYIEQEQPELIGTIPASKSVITSVLSGFNGSMEIKTDGNRIPIGQKWQEKTRDGRIEIKEIKQIGNKLAVFGINPNIEIPENSEFYFICNSDGTNRGGNTYWDLLPYNPLLTTLEKELEELRSKEKEILEKIEELKK